jgi:hypothetical protein
MLVIALGSVFIDEDKFEAMEDWGKEREEWFRTFLELPNGSRLRHFQAPVASPLRSNIITQTQMAWREIMKLCILLPMDLLLKMEM